MGEKINKKFNQWEKYNPSDAFATYSFARTLTDIFTQQEFDTPEFNDVDGLFHPYDDAENAEMDFTHHSHQIATSYFFSKLREQTALQDTIKLIFHISKHHTKKPEIFAPFFEHSKTIFDANERLLRKLIDNHDDYCTAMGEEPYLDAQYHSYKKYIPHKIPIDPKTPTDAIDHIKARAQEIRDIGQKNCDIKCGLVLRRLSLYHAFAQHGEYPDYIHLPPLQNMKNNGHKHAFLSSHLDHSIDLASEEKQTLLFLSERILDMACQIFPDHKQEIYAPPIEEAEPPLITTPLSSILTDDRYDTFNELAVYNYTKRCLIQLKAGKHDDYDLDHLAASQYGYDKFLSKATPKSLDMAINAMDKKYRDNSKILNESLMINKIEEHKILMDAVQLLSLLNAEQNNDITNELIDFLKQEAQYANQTINKLFMEDVAYCTVYKQKSRIEKHFVAYRKKGIEPVFLDKKFPEDAIEIQDLLLAKLGHIARGNCDTQCFKILNDMAYYQAHAANGYLDDNKKELAIEKMELALSNALQSRHFSKKLCDMIEHVGDGLITQKINVFNTNHRPKP